MSNKKILYIDTETTDTQSKDLLQLAIITDNSDIWLNLYFKPIQEISFGAMAIHNITPEDVENLPTFEETELPKEGIDPEFKGKTLKEYLEFLSLNYVWVAHNVEFDVEVIEKKGVEVKEVICTLKVARNALTTPDGRDLESYKLQYLRYYLGLYKTENKDFTKAHDALSDVYFLRDLYKYLENNTKLSIENMIMITKQPQVMREMSFGKYMGRTFEEIERVDREYLEWLVESMNDKPDLQWNAKLALDNGIRNRTQSLF
ncbi:MAG: polymerase III, epsilon subunit, DNA polymerase III subunit epsilon protein [candidate division WS6 bacterium GW2011_GWC1_33_20]|uniref:Exonuclease n=2 Tax=Candidatus Dojkabacteria TaxID=74243 RepID=A0A0G0ACS1_9BACT|nr:MAG: polymerase III, epsilon subunit, DNA polymerase III subunit epsilon protein [candidate division WS6 bacterium GW2011_GWE2_33_157]KKP43573.1 MAG: polymerase III, epsilon subunit, DNA polymerase III subunit epsilon protein [candidate division WS6 bacterium GW2011_GWC1_33_20]KKP45591.1 MAG: polymerase III, epsilon subunit, DNA polymerase III subunit epsilon protein [candidate division WS6 bacterium GW2011_GWF1_33_233]KKP54358.1 MAG: Exonuclease [candidate division WS6 bacterium GW2011_GWB1_